MTGDCGPILPALLLDPSRALHRHATGSVHRVFSGHPLDLPSQSFPSQSPFSFINSSSINHHRDRFMLLRRGSRRPARRDHDPMKSTEIKISDNTKPLEPVDIKTTNKLNHQATELMINYTTSAYKSQIQTDSKPGPANNSMPENGDTNFISTWSNLISLGHLLCLGFRRSFVGTTLILNSALNHVWPNFHSHPTYYEVERILVDVVQMRMSNTKINLKIRKAILWSPN